MKTSITTFALLALITSSAFAALKAPLPEFKNEKQLAEWRAEKASQSNTRATAQEPAFYTGKPYLASSGSYAFRYRAYNPEMARWTSEDPSGFPDGANGNIYGTTPNSQLDYQGLSLIDITGKVIGKLGDWTRQQVENASEGIQTTLPLSGTRWDNPWNAPGNAQVTYSLSGEFKVNATVAGTGFEGTALGGTAGAYPVAPRQSITLESKWTIRWVGSVAVITHDAWSPKYTQLPE